MKVLAYTTGLITSMVSSKCSSTGWGFSIWAGALDRDNKILYASRVPTRLFFTGHRAASCSAKPNQGIDWQSGCVSQHTRIVGNRAVSWKLISIYCDTS